MPPFVKKSIKKLYEQAVTVSKEKLNNSKRKIIFLIIAISPLVV